MPRVFGRDNYHAPRHINMYIFKLRLPGFTIIELLCVNPSGTTTCGLTIAHRPGKITKISRVSTASNMIGRKAMLARWPYSDFWPFKFIH